MNGQITQFIKHHYRHFNSAALIDAAEGYVQHMNAGGKMMITLAGAMSTAELGLSLAEMIRQDKVQIISCTRRILTKTCSPRRPGFSNQCSVISTLRRPALITQPFRPPRSACPCKSSRSRVSVERSTACLSSPLTAPSTPYRSGCFYTMHTSVVVHGALFLS
jgi:hypothetical protein